jgi:hypothetical protein
MKTTKTVRITCCFNCLNLELCWDVCRFTSLICSLHDLTPLPPRLSSRLFRGCLLSDWKVVLVFHKEVDNLLIASLNISLNISLLTLLLKKLSISHLIQKTITIIELRVVVAWPTIRVVVIDISGST